MGTKMAPSYANLFMAELEEKLLANYPIKPILWKRYIDDILCIWPGPPSELDRFMKYLKPIPSHNKIHPRKFYTQCGFPRLNHLQSLRHTTSLILDIAPFFKSTNKFQYLEYSSAHPIGTFTSLTKGELTRLLRACSDRETYKKVSDKLLLALTERGYPNHLLRKTLDEVPFENGTKILEKVKDDKQTYDTVKYSPDLDVDSIRTVLKTKDHEKGRVPNPCLSLSRRDNIAKRLVRAKLKECPDPPKSTNPMTIKITKPGSGNSMPCGNPGCKCCTSISKKCRVTSTHNNKTYPTQRFTCCATRNIIYLIECTRCTKGNQYIGHTTTPLRTQLPKHISESTIKV